MFRNFLIAVIIFVFVVAGVGLWAFGARRAVDPSDLLDRQTFKCLAASESMRTIGFARHKRKTTQITRIERLLEEKLEDLDRAKLQSERAILAWESEDAKHLRNCAEAYYVSGGTKLRETFDAAPQRMDYSHIELAFEEALQKVPERLRPHGFDERAALHLSEAALATKKTSNAIKLSREHIESNPQGLYTDTLKLVLADALLIEGEVEEAQALYTDVGRMRIGQDAQYARYRLSKMLEARGKLHQSQSMLDDVRRWTSRGGRQPLERTLSDKTPKPPLAAR